MEKRVPEETADGNGGVCRGLGTQALRANGEPAFTLFSGSAVSSARPPLPPPRHNSWR